MVTLTYWTQYVGAVTLNIVTCVGHFCLFLSHAFRTLCSTRLKVQKTIVHMSHIGVDSAPIILLTGLFTGMTFALQSYVGFKRMGGESLIGLVVALGVIRELGPVLTALIVTGRVGSAITAELGTMAITEQLDALRTLCLDIHHYLIVPRLVASVVIFPFLTLFCMGAGIFGGFCTCVYVIGLSPHDYINSIVTNVDMIDIVGGLIKSLFFGFIVAAVACYKGYYTTGGARGVGFATTKSVVTSSMFILMSNYFLTKLLEHL